MTGRLTSLEYAHNEGKKLAIIWILSVCFTLVAYTNMTYIMAFTGGIRLLLLIIGGFFLLFSVMGLPSMIMGTMYYFADGYFTIGYRG